jgi:hypothetical protein
MANARESDQQKWPNLQRTHQPLFLTRKKNDVLITEHKVKFLMYADQTGLFAAVSSLGNKYVMTLHHVDSNSSWSEAMQNQLGGKLILARARALARMQHHGLIPKHQILDNQASAEYKAAIEASGMTYELVPPKEHQCNMAEKAIQTFKDHFVGVLSGCAPTMSIHLWCNSPTGQTAAPPSSTISCASKLISVCTCLQTPRL